MKCDEHNDESEEAFKSGHNFTVCAWKTVVINGDVVRIAVLGYSRKSVPQADAREELFDHIFSQLKDFHDKLPESLKTLSPDVFEFHDYDERFQH